MSQPILLFAPEPFATRVAEALRAELDMAVDTAAHRRAALACMRRAEYALVLMEESLAAADPEATDALYAAAGHAPVLEINFAISGLPRVVRHVKSSLARRAYDQAQARAAVAASLESELSASLSGLLLESQLALREATPRQAPKLRHVVELAGDLRDRLRAH
jgi:hypothetical protein